MDRFRYLGDPLFLTSLAIWLINRLVLKALIPDGFVHTHLVDCLLIPFFLPPLLGLMRLLRIRRHDRPPELVEIGIPLVVWSIWFEIVLPLQPDAWSVSDPWDVVAYATGGALSWLVWNRHGIGCSDSAP